MGLSMEDASAIYLSTFDGFFERKLKEPKPGSIQRVNKNNETINVMRNNRLVGRLTKIEYKVTEKYGAFWSLTIVDDATYKLDLSVTSSSTFYFLNRLINADVDLKAPIELKVFAEVEDDKKKTVILLKQKGVFINGVYTKDNPQDLPPMKQVMFKGKLEWDSTDRDAFLRDVIEKYVAPELDDYAPAVDVADEPLDGPMDDTDLPDWAKDEPVKQDPFVVATTPPVASPVTPSPTVAPNGQPLPPPRKQPIPPPTAKDELPKVNAPAPPKAPAKARGAK